MTFRIAADARSFVSFRRIENSTRRWPDGVHSLPIRARALGGEAVLVRPGTADNLSMVGTFGGCYHLPPLAAGASPRLIWDLGANIGLTMAHFAYRYPSAVIMGVELDNGNAMQAERNVRPWSARCEVIRGAVWTHEGPLQYVREEGDEQGFRISRDASDLPQASAKGITLTNLLGRTGWRQIDYVKMDIEGAEREVLRFQTAWAEQVRTIKVEVHPPYTVGECLRDLQALGFDARIDDRHPALVVGVRQHA